MIRVLHSVSNMDRGGIETMLMNYYRHIDREKVQFDFIVNKQKPGDYDDEIRRLGGHIYQSPGLNPLHYPAYLRFVQQTVAADPPHPHPARPQRGDGALCPEGCGESRAASAHCPRP